MVIPSTFIRPSIALAVPDLLGVALAAAAVAELELEELELELELEVELELVASPKAMDCVEAVVFGVAVELEGLRTL